MEKRLESRLRSLSCALILIFFIVAATSAEGVSIPDIVRKCGPAVVMIFRQEGDQISSMGSGFLVDPTGIIVTNFHVVRNATSIWVKLISGEIYRVVKIVNLNKDKDICLIKIEGFDLPYVILGNSNEVAIGENCFAIGNPQGFENTVSTGIISGRRLYKGFTLFQTTTPVSPGSSGGPLINERGEVIGVLSLTWTEPGSQNINFAIPINYVRGMLGSDAIFKFEDLKDDDSRVVGSSPEVEFGKDELEQVKPQMPKGVIFCYYSGTVPIGYIASFVKNVYSVI